MGRLTGAAVLTAATAAGAAVTGRMIKRRRAGGQAGDGRHVITVFRPFDEVRGNLPAPLSALGDAVEVKLAAAPGGRGTEISARPVDDRVAAGDLRRALRESRSLLEVGDVLRPGGPPTTRPTPFNRPLRAITRRGREEGLL
jgi:hypothetical protein